jgi:hypothetical protein
VTDAFFGLPACRWTGTNRDEMREFTLLPGRNVQALFATDGAHGIHTARGPQPLWIGDVVVRNERDQFLIVPADVVAAVNA